MKHILFIVIFINLLNFSLSANDSSKSVIFTAKEVDYLRNVKQLKISLNSNIDDNKEFIIKKEIKVEEHKSASPSIYLYLLLFILILICSYLLYKQRKLKKENILLVQKDSEFKYIFNSTMEGICIFEDSYCIDINDTLVELLAYENKNELLGLKAEDVTSSAFLSEVQHTVYKNDTKVYECEAIRKDGVLIPILVKAETFILNHKTIRVAAILDLSELKRKDKLLSQKAKMSALGEMLGNISHQWRQPLSTISTAASGVMLQKDMDTLEDKFFYEAMNTILNNINYLSKTIDVFRNFIKEDKSKSLFCVNTNIKNTISIVSSVLKMNNIEVVLEFSDNFNLNNYENEFCEAIMNILNNSKDALLESKLENKYIFIKIYNKYSKTIIEIKDNAGGISDEYVEKVFEPYFTTKHKSQGTGLGLYIVSQIVVESMKGTICASNVSYKYKGISYKGAMFRLSL